MDNYNKLFMIIRKTDLLNYDEKNELQIYLMNLKEQVKKQKEVIDKVNNHIKNKLQKSDAYEMGLKNSSYKDRLYSETYIELQDVLNILKEVSE